MLWFYVPEITINTGFSVTIFCLKASVLTISLTTPYLMSSTLQSYGTFWLYGGFAFLGGVGIVLFMKETLGLTDKEKKRGDWREREQQIFRKKEQGKRKGKEKEEREGIESTGFSIY